MFFGWLQKIHNNVVHASCSYNTLFKKRKRYFHQLWGYLQCVTFKTANFFCKILCFPKKNKISGTTFFFRDDPKVSCQDDTVQPVFNFVGGMHKKFWEKFSEEKKIRKIGCFECYALYTSATMIVSKRRDTWKQKAIKKEFIECQ